jgi:hypothetical protein
MQTIKKRTFVTQLQFYIISEAFMANKCAKIFFGDQPCQCDHHHRGQYGEEEEERCSADYTH